MITIDNNIPMTARGKTTCFIDQHYNELNGMAIGESFVMPFDQKNLHLMIALRNKFKSRKWSSRKFVERGVTRYRIWRVE
jgi:hypothetical protein